MEQAFQALTVIVLGVGGCVGYFYLSNLLLDHVLFPARGPNMGRNINRASMVRPWLFLFPALFALGLYLAYPVVATAWNNQLVLDGVDDPRLDDFVTEFRQGPQTPEPGASCEDPQA